ncbi:HNH endonuclease [Candidatus Woesearchaeota archaeon]|nr:HNH endonuclease [Candidatus Woesearchaeota archaeon]
MKKKTYVDNNGYLRFTGSKKLVHRWVAYSRIYKPNRYKYFGGFSRYQVHHIDGNKLNNNVSNLRIVTKREHEDTHRIEMDGSRLNKGRSPWVAILATIYVLSPIDLLPLFPLDDLIVIGLAIWYYVRKK